MILSRKSLTLVTISLLLTVLTSLYGAYPALAMGEPIGYPTVYRLNIRSGPATSYRVVSVAQAGQPLKLLGRNQDVTWVQILLPNGNLGWAYATFIQSNINLHDLPVVDDSSPPPGGTPLGYVRVRYLNVRAGPGLNHPIISNLNWNTWVTLLGRNAESSWLQVYLTDNRNGWVYAPYISTTYPLSQLPVVSDPQPTPHPAAQVNVHQLNFRSGPGLTFPVMTRLGYGAQVGLLGRNADSSWLMVDLGRGGVAWAYAALLYTTYPIADLPLIMN